MSLPAFDTSLDQSERGRALVSDRGKVGGQGKTQSRPGVHYLSYSGRFTLWSLYHAAGDALMSCQHKLYFYLFIYRKNRDEDNSGIKSSLQCVFGECRDLFCLENEEENIFFMYLL